jgi:Tol biopolymer transport system component
LMPTSTAVVIPTPFPFPLEPMTPFPTVTPNYIEYETKSVFLSFGGYGGDGGSNTDGYYGRFTPSLIIYGDGQLLLREGVYRESITFSEATLSPSEMCILRQQIETTGFLEPRDKFFTQNGGGAGAGVLGIQVENIVYTFYGPDVQNLVEDLAAGIELIENYRPAKAFIPYYPTYLRLWIEEITPDEQITPLMWPSNLPTLEELWSDREQNIILVEGEWVEPIFNLFSRQLTQKIFQEEDNVYSIIARPLLPHETPRHIGYYPSLPRDYVPVLNCEDEPAIISPAIPTATPTLTAPATQLIGQGRIAFIAGSYSNQEIFVIEADGTTRLRLTNNLFTDSEPAWSPDGKRIAFVSEQNDNRDIYVMDANGSNMMQLTDHVYDDYSPTWSPDGTKIAFISDRDGGWEKSEIYVMNADGSVQQRLTQNGTRDLQPVWSPDGRKIAFVKSSTLAILTLDQSEEEEQTPFTTGKFQRPAWSPDSSQIAIVYSPNIMESTIRIINVDDMMETQTFNIYSLELPTSLDWSIAGDYIIFAARDPNIDENAIYFSEYESYFGNWNIYALDLLSQGVIQITFTEQDELSPVLWP